MIRLKVSLTLVCGMCCLAAVGILSGCGGVSGNSVSPGSWNLAVARTGAFAPGGTGEYSITSSNGTADATSGTVSVTDTLPNVFTASSASGNGWTCTLSPASCSRADSLAAGASYPPITLIVKVAQNASGTVTDMATVSGGGPGSASQSVQTPIGSANAGKIQHVVIIFQENRSTDNLFQDPVLINRGADIQSYGYAGNTKITLTPVSLVTNYDLDHGHPAFLQSCDWNGTECAMDGAYQVNCGPPNNCPPNPQYQYVQASDVQPYYAMAETYAFGDRMFQTNQGPSFPAHQYILSGTSAICVPGATCPDGTTSTYYLAGNPEHDKRADGTSGAGCLAPPGEQLNILDTSLPFPNPNLIELQDGGCVEHPTLTDLLDASALSWKYYASEDGSIWTAPDAIQHMCLPTAGPRDQLTCNNPDWTAQNPHVVIEGTGAQVVTDIQNCQLPSVTWVIPDGPASDHARGNNGTGPSWVASIVNQIGENATCPGTGETYWNDTAIIVTWDDWGGWYDHVSPPIRNSGSYQNSYEYGFRVPIIVISPYVKPAYISHQYNDFGSILKFIEETFSLPEVNPSVGYADSYALGDLSDFFNYSQSPLPFTEIPADYDRQYFINRKGTPSPPDDD
ncbi:MAG: alkaline phosphatase family protein [Terriglobales bacterium]